MEIILTAIYKFSNKSLEKLAGVDVKLQTLAKKVLEISPFDFAITEGFRDRAIQNKYFCEGKSKCDGINTLSKHQQGLAIDIIVYDENGKGTWQEKYYYQVAGIFKAVAKQMNINIRWGGDFKSIVDMPHFELC
jgi:peptidoglycan L-alanyl-D-glutamate endopeptidase CwlK